MAQWTVKLPDMPVVLDAAGRAGACRYGSPRCESGTSVSVHLQSFNSV